MKGIYRLLILALSGAALTMSVPQAFATPSLMYLQMCQGSVKKGDSSSARVYLDEPAPSGGLTVTMSSSTTNFQIPSGAIYFSENQTSAATDVNTSTPTAATGTITASYSSTTAASTFASTTGNVFSTCIAPNRVQGGEGNRRVTGYVKLASPAGLGGVTVTLSTSNSAILSLPVSSFVIPQYEDSATFNVDTHAVDADTSATITVSAGSSLTNDVTVIKPILKRITAQYPTCYGGGWMNGTVDLLADAAPSDTVVTLTRGTTDISIPGTVTIPAGDRSASFRINCNSVGSLVTTSIDATLDGRVNTVSFDVSP